MMFSYKIDEETELRLLSVEDAEEVFALTNRNRDYLREWLPWVDHTTSVEVTRSFIKESLEQFAANEGFSAAIWHSGQIVGVIGFHRIDWPNRNVGIGYWLGAEFQGKGIVTRAARALIDYSFEKLKLNRVEIHCARGNRKSRAIAERLGFRQEGVLLQSALINDRYLDMVVYAMLREEWRPKSGAGGGDQSI